MLKGLWAGIREAAIDTVWIMAAGAVVFVGVTQFGVLSGSSHVEQGSGPVAISWELHPYPSCEGAAPDLAPGGKACVVYRVSNAEVDAVTVRGIAVELNPAVPFPAGCPKSSINLSGAQFHGVLRVPGRGVAYSPHLVVTMAGDTPQSCMGLAFSVEIHESLG